MHACLITFLLLPSYLGLFLSSSTDIIKPTCCRILNVIAIDQIPTLTGYITRKPLTEDVRLNILARNRTSMGITHPSHPEHGLELKNFKKPYTCDGCKEEGFGKRYRCEECNYDLHEHCTITKSTASHDFFENSTFKFFDEAPMRKCNHPNCDGCHERYCDACGKRVQGFVYHCAEDGWDLHPCCRNLKNQLNIEGVKLRLCDTVLSKCIWCQKRRIEDSLSSIKGWSYVSDCKRYHLHVYCATEMLVEGWREGTNGNESMALENMKQHRIARLNRNINGRSKKYWRMVKILLKTIACILLGGPTIALTSFVVDLVVN